MKIIKLLLNAILIVSFLCGCSKNIDKKEDAPTKTEENKKEDNKDRGFIFLLFSCCSFCHINIPFMVIF